MKLKYVNEELSGSFQCSIFQVLDLKEKETYYFNSFKELEKFLKEHLKCADSFGEKYTFNYYDDAKIVFSIPDKNDDYDKNEAYDEVFEVALVFDYDYGCESVLEFHPMGYLYLLKEEK